jgi:hypothetical protein
METLEYELNKCLAGRGVAVAQILGMTTDANVVATLNPGLSMRNLDEGIVAPRAQTSSPLASRAVTHSGQLMIPSADAGSLFSGPVMITPLPMPLQVRASSEPMAASSGRLPVQAAQALVVSGPQAVQVSMQMPAQAQVVELAPPAPYETPSIKRSGVGVFGWLLLAAVLFGGIGALLYVALGERGERGPSKMDEATQPGPRVGLVEPGGSGARPNGSGDGPGPGSAGSAASGGGSGNVIGPGSAGSAASGSGSGSGDPTGDDPDRGGDRVKPDQGGRKPPRQGTVRRPPGVDERDPKALLKQGKQYEKANDWEAARATYQKLEKIKGQAGMAQYLQAWVALHMNDTDTAIRLSQSAINISGSHKTDAKFLYGDALYKQGEYARAKDVYQGLRKALTGELKATATRKLAAANKALKLPESDGMDP